MKKLNRMQLKIFILFLLLLAWFPIAEADLIGGNPKGAITLVEFFDYTCPHCQKMHTVVEQLIKTNPQLRVVYRPIPVLSKRSVFPALSVLAADYQHKALILNRALLNATQALTSDTVLAIAKKAGINTEQLMRDMQKPDVEQNLRENMILARKLGVRYLPTFILGRSGADQPDKVFYGEVKFTDLNYQIQNLITN